MMSNYWTNVEEAKELDQPENNGHNNDYIDDAFDGWGHRHVFVDYIQANTDQNQYENELD
jgi:hypothetical protein